MSSLPPGWRRKPLPNCPLCGGKGKALWQMFNRLNPIEYVCIGRKLPTKPGKKGKALLVESSRSVKSRDTWLEHASSYEHSCACVILPMTQDFHKRLKRIAGYVKRVAANEKIAESSLNDSLKNI